eukprot:9155150-Pyramimonas_sp.AAC.1
MQHLTRQRRGTRAAPLRSSTTPGSALAFKSPLAALISAAAGSFSADQRAGFDATWPLPSHAAK